MQPDAEHQQNDADLGELQCQFSVGDEAGRRRSDQHARQQVTDQGWDAQVGRQCAEDESNAEGGDDGGDKR
jgi:hypothetical protein